MPRYIVYEDSGWERLLPLTYMRCTFQLLCGLSDLLHKVRVLAGPGAGAADHDHSRVEAWCRAELRDVLAEGTGLAVNQPARDLTVFLNGRGIWRQLPVPDMNCRLNRQARSKEPWVGTAGPQQAIVCIAADEALAAQLSPEVLLDPLETARRLVHLPRCDMSAQVQLIDWPWELVLANRNWQLSDWSLLNMVPEIVGEIGPGSYCVGSAGIYVGEGSSIKPCVVIDAELGPVWIGRDVTIMPHCYVEGPACIGDGCLVRPGTVLHGGTTIGPRCKIGGEIEQSILQGYSNKQHDGFLGHSYIGSWVNLAADCVNSDLKNTYGSVRVPINGTPVDTHEMFVGMLVGDYSKAGINASFPTGAVVGFCSSVFVAQSPKFVPSFTWLDGSGCTEFDETRGLATARKVMLRRDRVMSPAEERLFLEIARCARRFEQQPDAHPAIQRDAVPDAAGWTAGW